MAERRSVLRQELSLHELTKESPEAKRAWRRFHRQERRYRLAKTPWRWLSGLVACLLSAFLAFCIIEGYTHTVSGMLWRMQGLNVLAFLILELLALAVFASTRAAANSALFIALGLGLINYLVMHFRSTPFVPWDLYSTGTALSVLKGYAFPWQRELFRACFLFVLGLLVNGFLPSCYLGSRQVRRCQKPQMPVEITDFIATEATAAERGDEAAAEGENVRPSTKRASTTSSLAVSWVRKFRQRYLSRLAMLGAGLLLATFFCSFVMSDRLQKWVPVNDTLFNLPGVYRSNGFMVSYIRNFRYLEIPVPAHYSLEGLQEEAQRYVQEAEEGRKPGKRSEALMDHEPGSLMDHEPGSRKDAEAPLSTERALAMGLSPEPLDRQDQAGGFLNVDPAEIPP